MAQFSQKRYDFFNPTNNDLYEVMMIANKNGLVVNSDNPFPVTMGSGGLSGGTISAKPWGLDVSQGNVTGHSFVHKFGAVPAMSNNQSGSVWDVNDTDYPWSAFDTPGIITIATTAANGSTVTTDNGLNVVIEGLDSDYAPATDTLTISGSTATGTTTFKRVFRAYVTDGSSSNTSQIRMSRGATEVARINIGKSQTLMAVYTIPAGKTGYLMQGTSSIQYGADATGDMFVRYFGQDTFRVGHSFEVSGAGGYYNFSFGFPIPVPQKSDIDVRASMRTNNARLTASFDLLLVDN
jgi:hypothetical protein